MKHLLVGIPTVEDGVRVLPVACLVELKLASGMTNADRLKDLADVQELIRAARLPLELESSLDPMVRAKYAEIWAATRQGEDDDDGPPPAAP